MGYLDEALAAYSRMDIYPFHMPGHKRRGLDFPNPYAIDITEIDGFDNLHRAEGILKESQERAAALYGTGQCYYLVNGSTCGLLAAICAAAGKRERVLVARNCHKAVYHALFLNELSADYLYPRITARGLQGQVTPGQVREALGASSREGRGIAAVIVTSPTYEGILSDIAGIAEVCHASGIPLIVDEAHGAHLGFGGGFPENATRLGADAVVMSLHKTLPSFTQTALLYLNPGRMDAERVEQYLDIFETSSPSYVLMAGMEACVRLLEGQGKEMFSRYREKLDGFYRDVEDLKRLHVMAAGDLGKEDAYAWDDSKLVIFGEGKGSRLKSRSGCEDVSKPGISGDGMPLYRLLLEKYHLQMEMASGSYVLGMTSIMDSAEGFGRLASALRGIDGELAEGKGQDGARSGEMGSIGSMYLPNKRTMEIYQAMALPCREVTLEEAVGKISAGYVTPYPPGIPMLVPGEIVSRQLVEKARECLRQGLRVDGCGKLPRGRLNVIEKL